MNTLEEWTVVISTKRPSKDIVVNLFSSGLETATELVLFIFKNIYYYESINFFLGYSLVPTNQKTDWYLSPYSFH